MPPEPPVTVTPLSAVTVPVKPSGTAIAGAPFPAAWPSSPSVSSAPSPPETVPVPVIDSVVFVPSSTIAGRPSGAAALPAASPSGPAIVLPFRWISIASTSGTTTGPVMSFVTETTQVPESGS